MVCSVQAVLWFSCASFHLYSHAELYHRQQCLQTHVYMCAHTCTLTSAFSCFFTSTPSISTETRITPWHYSTVLKCACKYQHTCIPTCNRPREVTPLLCPPLSCPSLSAFHLLGWESFVLSFLYLGNGFPRPAALGRSISGACLGTGGLGSGMALFPSRNVDLPSIVQIPATRGSCWRHLLVAVP